MMAKKKSKKTTNKVSAGSGNVGGGGGGFGMRTSTTKSTIRTAQITRSVSGHTGSGTKPLRAAANTFDALRKEFGVDACRDVYVRAPLNDPITFWFVGKIASRSEKEDGNSNNHDDSNNNNEEIGTTITPEMAIWSQKRLILEYAKHQLRPQNLGGKFSEGLEVWLAPGDSEMDVVQNKIPLQKVTGSVHDLPVGFTVKDTVGYNPEIYMGDEITMGGLRVQRDPETGEPINPVFEVNQSA